MAIKVNGKLVAGLGKSAYEQAQEGGYTGTEEEFISTLANIGSNPTAEGLPVNDVRTGTVRDGQSIAAGDVVNVQNGEVYHDVVAQKNVENVIKSGVATTGTALCKLSLQHSVLLIIAGNITAFLIDNVTGKSLFNSVVYQQSSSSVSLARLDDTHFVVQALTQTTLFAKIGTINGTSILFGEQTNIISAVTGSAPVVALEADRIMSIFTTNSKLCIRISLVNGTTIILIQDYLPGNVNASHISATRLPDDDSGNKRVCICFSDTGDGNKGKAVIATVDSSNAVTFGDVVTFANVITDSLHCVSNDNDIYVTYRYSGIKGTKLSASGNIISVTIPETSLNTNNIEHTSIKVGNRIIVADTIAAYVLKDETSTLSLRGGFIYKSTSASKLTGCEAGDNKILLAYADTGNSNYGTTTILEISGNQIAGSFLDNSKDAIALESGKGGDTIKFGFGGYCACEGITAGQTIDSEGVTAYSPLDGWLEIKDQWAKGYVTGEYTGNSVAVFNIDLGFKPAAIVIADASYNFTISMVCFRGCSQLNYMHKTTLKSAGITWNDAGVSLSDAANINLNNYKYRYIAWR